MKALVLYGTRYGGTKGIAETMAETLTRQNIDVDILEETSQAIDYDLIIIGSGIKAGQWTENTQLFLSLNQKQLSETNTAFFVSCGEAMKPSREDWIKKRYIQKKLKRYPKIKPNSLGVFGGVFDFEGKHKGIHNPYLSKLRKKFDEQGLDTSSPIDYRDLNKVREWTTNLLSFFSE